VYGYDINKIMDYALAAGSATVMSEYPINPDLSFALLDKIIKGE